MAEKVVAYCSYKGGVGKTIGATSTAREAARIGQRTLLIDLDKQANAGVELGYAGTDLDDQGQALAASLLTGSPLAVIKNMRPGLDIAGGGRHLAPLARYLTALDDDDDPRALGLLGDVVGSVLGEYDLVVIDCPASLDHWALPVFGFARHLVMPLKPDKKSFVSVAELVEELVRAVSMAEAAGIENDCAPLMAYVAKAKGVGSGSGQRMTDALVDQYGHAIPIGETVLEHESLMEAANQLGQTVLELVDTCVQNQGVVPPEARRYFKTVGPTVLNVGHALRNNAHTVIDACARQTADA